MQKKAARLFVLPILFLISCSGSSNDNPSSFVDDPLNLSTGQCFNDFSSLDLDYGDDSVDAGSVEVVNCMSPHNGEVIAVYSSVPLSGRNSSDPAHDICFNEMFGFVKSFFPNLNDYEFILFFNEEKVLTRNPSTISDSACSGENPRDNR